MNMNKPPDETRKQGRNRSWLLVKNTRFGLAEGPHQVVSAFEGRTTNADQTRLNAAKMKHLPRLDAFHKRVWMRLMDAFGRIRCFTIYLDAFKRAQKENASKRVCISFFGKKSSCSRRFVLRHHQSHMMVSSSTRHTNRTSILLLYIRLNCAVSETRTEDVWL